MSNPVVEQTAAKTIDATVQTMQTVNNILVDLASSAAEMKDFAVEQIPDVMQQLLAWHFWKNLTYEIFGICLFVVCIVASVKLWKILQKSYDSELERYKNKDRKNSPEWVCPLSLFAMTPALASLFLCNITWLQILIAPKLYLLEYAASFVK